MAKNNRTIDIETVKVVEIDLFSYDSVFEFLDSYSPQLVINCAAITNVDDCEFNVEQAHLVNAELPRVLSQACHQCGVKFVQLSTDHLSNGRHSFVREESPVETLNIYAQTKAKGEHFVLDNSPSALIVRSNFFGWGTSYRKSFSDFILENLSDGKPIHLVNDVFYTPIVAQRLISGIYDLIDKNACGIYNVVGTERLSKYEFGMKIAQQFGCDTTLIKGIEWSSLNVKASRPLDMSLSCEKFQKKVGYDLGTVNDSITDLFNLKNSDFYNVVRKL